jgi:hypothetical protein
MDLGREASWNAFNGRTCPQEAETKRWTQGDHRGYEAALGGGQKGASAFMMPDKARTKSRRT